METYPNKKSKAVDRSVKLASSNTTARNTKPHLPQNLTVNNQVNSPETLPTIWRDSVVGMNKSMDINRAEQPRPVIATTKLEGSLHLDGYKTQQFNKMSYEPKQ